MNNVYRLDMEGQCDKCLDKAERIHELEQHDMDESDLKVAALTALWKLALIGSLICTIGGGAAAMGIWVFGKLEGTYGWIAMMTIWLFGAFLFIGSIIVVATYTNGKEVVRNRLDHLRHLRWADTRRRHDERAEQKKQKETFS